MMRRSPVGLAVLALVAAGCSRQAPAPPPQENVEEPAPVVPPPAPPPPAPPRKPPPPVANEADDEPTDDSAQTQEDADAVGMTTRATPQEDGDDTPAANAAVDESAR